MIIICSLVVWLALNVLTVGEESRAASGEWRYVVPQMGEPFAHPPLRALGLSDRRPDDLKEEVTYRGKKPRYSQLRYGSPNSVRVTIVVDEIAPGEVDLYVDAGRKRAIQARDKVNGAKLTWRLPLEVAIVEGDTLKVIPRTVLFRYGQATRTLGYATCGYVEGRVRIGDEFVAVRRVDGDGNGLLTDPQDRLWLDLDGSGRWDPLQHQFPFTPLLTLEGKRFAVQSDLLGERLAFSKLEGTGTIRLVTPTLPGGGEIEDISATLLSRDGIVATLRGKNAEAVLPVGEYRCTTVLLNSKDSRTGQLWGYIFSDNGAARKEWHSLAKDACLALNPVGQPQLACTASETSKCIAGEQVQLRPRLYTGEGLLITMVYLGREIPIASFGNGPQAVIALVDSGGAKLAEAASGFA
jgi:hypothetical protein